MYKHEKFQYLWLVYILILSKLELLCKNNTILAFCFETTLKDEKEKKKACYIGKATYREIGRGGGRRAGGGTPMTQATLPGSCRHYGPL